MQALLSRTRVRGAPLLLVSATALPAYLILNSDSLPSPTTPYKQPLKALLRSYFVYSLCSVPAIVDNSPRLLDALTKVPGLKQLTLGIVRVTFFDQFVGGESSKETLPVIQALRAANKGIIFSYSVEVDEHEAMGSGSKKHGPRDTAERPPHKRVVDEILRCIDVAGEFEDSMRGARGATVPYHTAVRAADKGRGSWVAIKLTAMLPNAHALINFSKCIILAREQETRRAKGSATGTEDVDYDTLLDMSKGAKTMSSTVIPFPGTPLPNDMRFIDSGSARNSKHSMAMTRQDIDDLYDLYHDLTTICARAQERGVKLLLDAEYSWYQPAIDALTLALMRKFNALPLPDAPDSPQARPLVYGTYQAYLRRTPLHLAYSLEDARKNNYALGVKLVRGAYHSAEVSSHTGGNASDSSSSLSISPDPVPPVWSTKEETDKAYNDCLRLLISAVKDDIDRNDGDSKKGERETKEAGWKAWLWKSEAPAQGSKVSPPRVNPGHIGVGVLFGTHNWASCNLVLDELRKHGLGKVVTTTDVSGKMTHKMELSQAVTDRVSIGQLYGMCDDLTDTIVHQTISAAPLVVKYVPYGKIEEVLPYLSRRAIENKSVLGTGGADRERARAAREIRKRFFGVFGAVE